MEENNKRERSENFQKAEKYAKFVKEMHWPKISKLKKQEMENLINSYDFKKSLNQSSHSQNWRGRAPSIRSESRNLNKKNGYISTSEPTFSGLENAKREGNHSYSILKQSKHIWKENKMIPKPQPKKEPKIIDYLMEKRMKRDKLESEGRIRKTKNPYLDIKNLVTDRSDSKSGGNQKFFNSRSMDNYGLQNNTIDHVSQNYNKMDQVNQIRNQSRMIEETVNRKEQLMKFQGGSIKESADVNEMLIDAISAKLRILEDL